MIKPAPFLIDRWLRLTGYRGITLPPFGVYVLTTSLSDERLIRHESAHWRQYERMGAVKFYALYLWYLIKYGYWGNPMEKEARDAETQIHP